jgi:hypothetical protein
MSKEKEPKLVSGLESGEMYSVSLTFRSMGDGVEVQPDFGYSHKFKDGYRGELPASYVLAHTLIQMLTVMQGMNEYYNQPDLPEDDLDLSDIEEAAAAASAVKDEDPTLN